MPRRGKWPWDSVAATWKLMRTHPHVSSQYVGHCGALTRRWLSDSSDSSACRTGRLSLGLLLAFALTACTSELSPDAAEQNTEAAPERQPDPIAVSAAVATRQPMAAVYSTSGTLRAERQATVTSRTRGVIKELFVEEGDVVAAEEPLAQLENNEQLLAVDRYETIHAIKSQEFERSRLLNDEDLISDAELEPMRQQLQELKHDLDLARLNLNRTTVSAPFAGIVIARHLDLGATVSDGTGIFDLADIDPLYLDVNVPERHVGRLSPGQTVQLFADAADEAAEARIERLSPVVDTSTGTVKVTVAVDSAVALRPGAFVEVDVVTDVRQAALVVPRSALVTEGRRWLVYRVSPTGDTAEALEVTIGFEEGQLVEIAGVVHGSPLAPGDRVVVRGASALSDGARLTIVEDAARDPEPPGKQADAAAAGGAG
ncbi:MAG: membrane fusion protein (multidrug efflux system) [Pseudohongiellaceae bacterium]|jgi:membrane fusion protein (multidrug efflux system)